MFNAGVVRVAMWSGPRNISTAMMRAWGNRDDTVVVDEPLYAHYLNVTRKPHPGAEEVIAAQVDRPFAALDREARAQPPARGFARAKR